MFSLLACCGCDIEQHVFIADTEEQKGFTILPDQRERRSPGHSLIRAFVDFAGNSSGVLWKRVLGYCCLIRACLDFKAIGRDRFGGR